MPAQLQLCYPDKPVKEVLLWEGQRYQLGRASDNEIIALHATVSRHHASFAHDATGWHLMDLHSSNGTSVDGHPVHESLLQNQHQLLFGAVPGRFELCTRERAHQWQQHREWRSQQSDRWLDELRQNESLTALLAHLVSSLLRASQTERGFVLVGQNADTLQLAHCSGFEAGAFSLPTFAGSVGVVERVLSDHQPVVVCDAWQDAWLSTRDSVQHKQIRALACLPIQYNGELLGVAYCDSQQPDKLLTELDLAILESLCHHAAITLMAARVQAELAMLTVSASRRGSSPTRRWVELVS